MDWLLRALDELDDFVSALRFALWRRFRGPRTLEGGTAPQTGLDRAAARRSLKQLSTGRA